MISGSCVFRIIWIYTVFAHFHTVLSLYLLYPASWILTAIAEMIYFFVTYKKITANLPDPEKNGEADDSSSEADLIADKAEK